MVCDFHARATCIFIHDAVTSAGVMQNLESVGQRLQVELKFADHQIVALLNEGWERAAPFCSLPRRQSSEIVGRPANLLGAVVDCKESCQERDESAL